MALVILNLTACSSKPAEYKDGVYTGQSAMYTNEDGTEDGNGYGVVTITIEEGEVTACTYQTFEPDGVLKDENYGMEGGEIANRDYYNKAQKAVAACDVYAAQFLETGSAGAVDAISGATVNYDLFREAVEDALKQAGQE